MSSSSFDADLLILGGGPAGCAAAITAAMAGVTTILLERESFPRQAPGESVHPGVQALFRQLGIESEVLAADFLRHPGHVVQAGGHEQYFPFGADDTGPWLGFQLWRAEFDAILLARSTAAGVSVIRPRQATGLLFENGEIVGVETLHGAFRTRFVVVATGRRRSVARCLNLDWDRRGPVRRAWYGYAMGNCPARAEIPALSTDAAGWTWVARVRPNIFAWTRLNFDASRPSPVWLPAELATLKPLAPTLGADVSWEVVRKPAGAGYFLVGDAAAVLDPAAGHGILKGLMSGIFVGHLVAEILGGAISASAAADAYSSWVHEWFRRDVAELDARYSRFGASRSNDSIEPAHGNVG
ncbi:NAD(P)/FAD-dependent oxidoreductase [Planctomicrobium piriforme]|uniref:Dehydrogenase (Flavoprotein) n=1 Tax=Planctomicrobium piriforme TaxID=1576369 RepID=A0A1I3GIG3_9PLAN|nr:FAD-dependent monooxygenase [Planctomicrobium piriforme]SFI23256.1 Dehydrogenase (flavoprotein) [Planctomicrobium piriforme]